MIIEFVGPPGSGKSTILKALFPHLKSTFELKYGNIYHKLRLIQVSHKIYLTIQYFIINPKKAIIITLSILKAYKFWIYAFNDIINVLHLNTQYLKAAKKKETIYIFDQGLIQAELSIIIHGQRTTRNLFQHNYTECDKIIIVGVDLEENIKRLKFRNSKKSRIENSKNYNLLLNWQKEINEVYSKLSSTHNNILKIDSSKNIEFNTIQIENYLSNN